MMTTPFAIHVLDQIRHLLAEHPELEEDEVLRADMVEGATDAHSFLRTLLRRQQEAESLATAIAATREALASRQDRMARRAEVLRAAMLQVMEAAHLPRVELPEATLSIRKGTDRVVIIDEVMVPHEFCRVRHAPDRIKIRQYIEAGNKPNWAAIVPGEPAVTVRVK